MRSAARREQRSPGVAQRDDVTATATKRQDEPSAYWPDSIEE
jgi:hypothetical protein